MVGNFRVDWDGNMKCPDAEQLEGGETCRNAFVDHKDLKKGFVAAYNKMMASPKRKAEWADHGEVECIGKVKG